MAPSRQQNSAPDDATTIIDATWPTDIATWQLAIRTDENNTLQMADTIAEYRRITNLSFH